MRLLVDTNIFIDYFFRNDENADEAERFFDYCHKNKNQIYITSMSLRDIGYLGHKYVHNEELVRDVQIKIYNMVTKICDTTADAAIEALYNDNSDYEDELQIIAAQEILADGIVTNDKKGFKNANMHVFTIKQANDLLSKQHPVVIE